jgi:hypothetical protein
MEDSVRGVLQVLKVLAVAVCRKWFVDGAKRIAEALDVKSFDVGVDLGVGRARIDRRVEAISVDLQ